MVNVSIFIWSDQFNEMCLEIIWECSESFKLLATSREKGAFIRDDTEDDPDDDIVDDDHREYNIIDEWQS